MRIVQLRRPCLQTYQSSPSGVQGSAIPQVEWLLAVGWLLVSNLIKSTVLQLTTLQVIQSVEVIEYYAFVFIYFITHFLWEFIFTFKAPTMLHVGFIFVLVDLYYYCHLDATNKAYLLLFFFFFFERMVWGVEQVEKELLLKNEKFTPSLLQLPNHTLHKQNSTLNTLVTIHLNKQIETITTADEFNKTAANPGQIMPLKYGTMDVPSRGKDSILKVLGTFFIVATLNLTSLIISLANPLIKK